jgi:RNA polymerase-interacting CarD/CdnL/TRCF family regulator
MNKIQMLLMEIITLDGAEWKDIVDYIRDKKIKITNWNKVRSELQELINSGAVYRVQQVKSEIYVRTT